MTQEAAGPGFLESGWESRVGALGGGGCVRFGGDYHVILR